MLSSFAPPAHPLPISNVMMFIRISLRMSVNAYVTSKLPIEIISLIGDLLAIFPRQNQGNKRKRKLKLYIKVMYSIINNIRYVYTKKIKLRENKFIHNLNAYI